MLALQQYGESDSDKEDEEEKQGIGNEAFLHLKPLSGEQSSIQTAICPAPAALPPVNYAFSLLVIN